MPQDEKPRSEPEIIRPDRAGRDTRRSRVFLDTRGTERIYVRERKKNLTIIIVEHEMGVIERITDRCVVLNFGRKIAEGPYREVGSGECTMSGIASATGPGHVQMVRNQ